MKQSAHSKIINSIEKPVLLFAVLLLAGCQGGGGGEGPSIGSLLETDQGPVVQEFVKTDGGPTDETITQLAKVHNPEPATMVLMGSGMLAVGYLRRRKQKIQR